jgi:CelD/BcsL family acetyltransferase involved in cellulose biosynthesis
MTRWRIESFDRASGDVLAAWDALIDANDLNPTLAPAWVQLANQTVGRRAGPMQLLIGSTATPIAIVPFFNSRERMIGLSTRILELASNFVSYHAGLVTADLHEEALTELLRDTAQWDVFRAVNIPVDSPTARAIEAVARRMGAPLQMIAGDASPYLPIAGSWDAFLATRNKKFRYKLRQRSQIADSTFRLEWLTSQTDCATLLRDLLTVEQSSWKAAEGMAISLRAAEIAYHEQLLPYLARNGMLLSCVLYKDARPVAYSLCCQRRGWVGHLKTSFDQAFAQNSAGGIVIDASIEKAFSLGAREFDFLGHDAPHKLAWSPLVRRHADYLLFAPRFRPRLIAFARNLKSWARARVQRLAASRRESATQAPEN